MTKTPTRTHEALRSDETISYGTARSTVEGSPLSPEELREIDEYWRASLYFAWGCCTSRTTPCSVSR